MPPSWTSNHEHCGKGITLTEDEEYTRPSPLDELFAELEMKNPDHIALKYYRSYYSGSAKTLKSIQITLAARLEKFNLESLAALTCTDELDLPSMGEKKVALYALIPDNDSSFNFLVYDILKHPNVAFTTDGKAATYKHGEVTVKHSALSVLDIDPNEIPEVNYGETTYELLSDEDFEVNKNLF